MAGTVSSGRLGRLKKRSQFLHLSRKGLKAALPGVVVQGLPADVSQSHTSTRLGFTVTKKVGNAVVRNRTRRRLREAIRLVDQENPLPAGDFVLIGREATRHRAFKALKDDVRAALERIAHS